MTRIPGTSFFLSERASAVAAEPVPVSGDGGIDPAHASYMRPGCELERATAATSGLLWAAAAVHGSSSPLDHDPPTSFARRVRDYLDTSN